MNRMQRNDIQIPEMDGTIKKNCVGSDTGKQESIISKYKCHAYPTS